GRPISTFIEANFTRGDKVPNKSNRYYWKCNHCGNLDNSNGLQIQGRDNKLPHHIADSCSRAPAELHQEARTFIFTKIRSTQDQSGTTLSEAVIPIKKRKKESLDGYVDHPLTKEQSTQANVRLLQWFIHVNIPFLAADDIFFQYFLDTIRPSYKAPS
ncbi:hypothetical protein BU15DRAFT_34292, partial [Melanogaster broomeanus]